MWFRLSLCVCSLIFTKLVLLSWKYRIYWLYSLLFGWLEFFGKTFYWLRNFRNFTIIRMEYPYEYVLHLSEFWHVFLDSVQWVFLLLLSLGFGLVGICSSTHCLHEICVFLLTPWKSLWRLSLAALWSREAFFAAWAVDEICVCLATCDANSILLHIVMVDKGVYSKLHFFCFAFYDWYFYNFYMKW